MANGTQVSDLLVPPIDTTPEDRQAILGEVYRPRRQSEFLMGMLRTLASGSVSIYRFGENSPPHRFLRSIAIELELLSRSFSDAIVLSIRTAIYRAFEDELLFPARGQMTYARGYVLLTLPIPTARQLVIEAGEVFSTAEGRTLRAISRVVWEEGVSSVSVPVASDTPGAVGNLPPGSIVSHATQKAGYSVTNPAPIAGGLDIESDASMYARYQNYIKNFRTASRGAVLSSVFNAFLPQERPRDAALILPWRIPSLNREMGYAYVAVDSGSGSASPAQLAKAQAGIDATCATAENISAISASPFIVTPTIEVDCVSGTNLLATEASIRTLWYNFMSQTLIEDGTGRGTVDLSSIITAIDRLPGILTVRLLNPVGDIRVPIAARAVAGAPNVTAIIPGTRVFL